ncbi:MAG: TetR/AcrR family transcriptional regulator [Acidimicrobiales bacterium]
MVKGKEPEQHKSRRPTQQQRRADTRARLVDAAAELFAERGIDGVSVDAVAAAAGRTSGAVYDHFGSKHGLLLALLDGWSGALVAVISAQFEISEDLNDRLGAVWDNVCANPSEDVRRLFLLEHEMWLRAARDPRLASALERRTRESNERVARGLARWSAQGRIELVADPETVAALLNAMVLGLHMQHQADPRALDRQAAVAAFSNLIGALPLKVTTT